jgi:DnaA family protein
MKYFQQLSLPIALNDQATFENFYAPNGTPQHMAIFLLKDESRIFSYISGKKGTGLSHLLQAACQASAIGTNMGGIYLPLQQLKDFSPNEVLDGLDRAALICIDDIDCVAHFSEWEVALFNLFNNCKDNGCRLVIASHLSVDEIEFDLKDLQSRLKSGITLVLRTFKDSDQRRLLQYRCNLRGLYLPDEVAIFLLNRIPRNSDALMGALSVLDEASLKEQRRLTIPFVKTILDL